MPWYYPLVLMIPIRYNSIAAFKIGSNNSMSCCGFTVELFIFCDCLSLNVRESNVFLQPSINKAHWNFCLPPEKTSYFEVKARLSILGVFSDIVFLL